MCSAEFAQPTDGVLTQEVDFDPRDMESPLWLMILTEKLAREAAISFGITQPNRVGYPAGIIPGSREARVFDRQMSMVEQHPWWWMMMDERIEAAVINGLPSMRAYPERLVDPMGSLDNPVPFLYYFDQKTNEVRLTLAGLTITSILKNLPSSKLLIKHGAARWLFGGWDEEIDPVAYCAIDGESALIIPNLDLDIECIGASAFEICGVVKPHLHTTRGPGSVNDHPYATAIIMRGLSMGDLPGEYLVIHKTGQIGIGGANLKGPRVKASDVIANDPKAFMQIIPSMGRDLFTGRLVNSRVWMQSMMIYARLRSFGFLAVLDEVESYRGIPLIRLIPFDPMGGLEDYSEVGGGLLDVSGINKNIIRFPYLLPAFADGSERGAIWSITRLLRDMFGVKAGGTPAVLIHEGDESSRIGSIENFRVIARKCGDRLVNLAESGEVIGADVMLELTHAACEVLAADPVRFLRLCGEEEVVDGVMDSGLGLSRLWPHIHRLTKHTGVGKTLVKLAGQSNNLGEMMQSMLDSKAIMEVVHGSIFELLKTNYEFYIKLVVLDSRELQILKRDYGSDLLTYNYDRKNPFSWGVWHLLLPLSIQRLLYLCRTNKSRNEIMGILNDDSVENWGDLLRKSKEWVKSDKKERNAYDYLLGVKSGVYSRNIRYLIVDADRHINRLGRFSGIRAMLLWLLHQPSLVSAYNDKRSNNELSQLLLDLDFN